MDTLNTWILPFTFIPGAAMLVLSTSNRYFHVKELIREIMLEEHKKKLWSFEDLMERAKLFYYALVVLYVAIGSFSLSALTGNIHQNWINSDSSICIVISDSFVLIGVVCIVLASAILIREATLSLRHIEVGTKDSQKENKI